jgi:PadR family transcriptional regulator, regulatory protein PadR
MRPENSLSAKEAVFYFRGTVYAGIKYMLTAYIIQHIIYAGDDMDVQMKRGILDGLVLSILKKGDTYGYELTEQISKLLEIAEMTLYPILKRLEVQGYLSTYSVEYSGRLRKYYKITGEGAAKLDEISKELMELRRLIDRITGEGETKHEQS